MPSRLAATPYAAAIAAAAALTLSAPLRAQPAAGPAEAFDAAWGRASHVVVPSARVFDIGRFGQAITIEAVTARITIREAVAATTLEVTVRNPGNRPVEAGLLMPVPDDAAVSGFDFEGAASEPTARLLPRAEARRIYDDIVRRTQDPALLEFVGTSLVRSSVFPVPAGGTQRVRLTFDHVLGGDGDRVDYVLPRAESLATSVDWDVQVTLASAAPISMVYSPSHALDVQRRGPGRFDISRPRGTPMEPGSLLLSFLRDRDGVNASIFAYPDPEGGGGMFLLMAGLAAERQLPADAPVRCREVTIVLDRSGSMAGAKMDQARAAALQVIEGLRDDESFSIIDYSSTIGRFSAGPVPRTRENLLEARAYLDRLRPVGGTNIHDALVTALRQPVTEGCLPIVLFLTDGLPTVGNTAETSIRALATDANPAERRIFAFGVGHDVNAPLLDRIAEETRATATYVRPEQDVEVAVGRVFRQLAGPVLSSLEFGARGPGAAAADLSHRLHDLAPDRLPDLFAGDELIILGRYRGDEPLDMVLGGAGADGARRWSFRFDPAKADVRHAFVPRLWASRRIAYLVDAIRQAGAAGPDGLPLDHVIAANPRLKELTDEILRLSARYGVLSEYTAFLATEGTRLDDWQQLSAACSDNLGERAVRTRTGVAAVNQSLNMLEGKQARAMNRGNTYWNAELERVSVTGVQQICDAALFRRDSGWIDGSLVTEDGALEPTRVVMFDTPEHTALVDALAAVGRAGTIALRGDILIKVGDEVILVRNPA